jgi:hypothetical protein
LPGAATKLLLVGLPRTWVAGQTESVTVLLKDAFGNVASGYTGTVHFASSDRQAILPDPYTFTTADAGRHTFPVIFNTLRPQRLVVADIDLPALKALDVGIQIHPGV